MNAARLTPFLINRSSEYKKVQQFVDSLLQPAQYMSKIESKLRTIVQEQAPPGTRFSISRGIQTI